MDDYCYLRGKVRKCTLPQVEPGQEAAPILKRLMLKQGELAQFYDSEEGLRYLALIELKEGATRGNHYHLLKDELIYLISGKLLLRVEEPGTKLREILELLPGDLVQICPGIAHSLEVLQQGFAVEASRARYQAADTYRYQLS